MNHLRKAWRVLALGDYAGGHQPPSDAPPIHDLVGDHSWFPEDVYDNPHYYGFGEWTATSARIIREVRGQPNALVTIYRSVPPVWHEPMQSQGQPVVHKTEPVIETGNWVAISLAYARNHGMDRGWEEWNGEMWVEVQGDWPVLRAKVPAHTVRNGGNDLIEWGYWGPPVRAEVI